MSGITLYDINAAYLQCLDEANAYGEEHGGETDPALEAKLEGLGMAREAKIENCLKYIKNITAEADALAAESSALLRREKSIRGRIEWMKNLLASIVGAGNKMKFSFGTIGWRSGKSLVVIDAEKIPAQYWRIIPESKEIEKTALKDAILASAKPDEEFPFAKVQEVQHIQIK